MTRALSALSAVAATAALALTGCGGGSGSGGPGAYGPAESTSSAQAATGESDGGGYGGGSSSAAGAGAVAVASVGDLGKVLVDSAGLTLYYFEKDKGGESACYGACADAWPPLTASGTPQAASGVDSSKLGTTRRRDGTVQVTYAGWPLYTYAADSSPGEDNGTDVDAFGAPWYPLHPDGKRAGD